jgi:hypothetical protein
MDEFAAVFAAVDHRIVVAHHPTGTGYQYAALDDRRSPPDEVWSAVREHAEAILRSDAYLAWLGSDPEAAQVVVGLGVMPPPG